MRRTAPMAGPAPGVLSDAPGAVDGEAHHGDGPIMMVWSSVRREAANPRRGRDVVLHEFAHKLDMLDGTLDGTPPLDDAARRARWVEVLHRRVLRRARRHGGAVLRAYAGTNPGEFFAVATEAFFTRPAAMLRDKPDLYDVLARLLPPGPGGGIRTAIGPPPTVDGRRAPARIIVAAQPRPGRTTCDGRRRRLACQRSSTQVSRPLRTSGRRAPG